MNQKCNIFRFRSASINYSTYFYILEYIRGRILLREERVTGIILAGGMSSRFGSNKALTRFDGEKLIHRLYKNLTAVTDQMILITNTPEDYGFLNITTQHDLIPNCGPIGGIYTALSTAQTSLIFCVACDMPFVNPAFLEHMIRRSKGYDVVVPIHNGQEEPLCAIYRKTCLKTIYDQISSQKFKITEFYKNVRVLRLNPSDSGFSENDMFFNINYPTDIKEALKRLKNQRLSS